MTLRRLLRPSLRDQGGRRRRRAVEHRPRRPPGDLQGQRQGDRQLRHHRQQLGRGRARRSVHRGGDATSRHVPGAGGRGQGAAFSHVRAVRARVGARHGLRIDAHHDGQGHLHDAGADLPGRRRADPHRACAQRPPQAPRQAAPAPLRRATRRASRAKIRSEPTRPIRRSRETESPQAARGDSSTTSRSTTSTTSTSWCRARAASATWSTSGSGRAATARRSEDFLYFGPSDGTHGAQRNVIYELEWGKSLHRLQAHAVHRQASEVGGGARVGPGQAQGHTGQGHRARSGDQANKDLLEIIDRAECEPREDVVVNEPMRTPEQAKQRALAILSDKLKELVTASGTTVGLPDLRAGQKVRIRESARASRARTS